MKYNEIYNSVNYNYPQCGGYIVKQSPDKKVLIIEKESNLTGCITGAKYRIKYTPVTLHCCTDDDIECILQGMLHGNKIEVIKKGYKIQ